MLGWKANHENTGILQSAFLHSKAKATHFIRDLKVIRSTIYYTLETSLKIYDKEFNYSDINELKKG